ncbi:MAG: hypothetical protein PWQ96_2380 [Clostridia bacterium]|jgi:NTE family protein|nr:patatin family protein [Clostridiales bacterium]MDK2986736.1 hypothetical protein [Clostridia bacterium]
MVKKTPKVGLVLSAGSSRGFAHLGVLKVLKDAGIPIDVIAGTSIGSVFGALYASGSDIDLLIKMTEHLKQQQYMDVSVPRWGLIKGKKIEELLKLLTKGLTFEELNIPLYVVAVDIENGEEVVFSKGPVYQAVRASISIPGIFEPQRINGKLYVDGAVLNTLPINLVKEHGVDITIAVEVKYGGIIGKHKSINNIFDVILHSIDLMQLDHVKKCYEEADILIKPDLSHINPNRFDSAMESISIGMEAAQKVLPQIKEAIIGKNG